jgi:site-specific recombinase XerD
MLAMSQSAGSGPRRLTPRDAWLRYIDRRRSESSEASLSTYYYRLKQFVEWAEAEGIESVSEFDGWTFESYETTRSGDDLAPSTLKGEMQTIKNWIEYLERIEAVDQGLAEKVHVPTVPAGEESDETQLLPADAIELLETFRETPALRATRRHALLEVLWFTGARAGGVRGLDLRDYSSDEEYLDFVHRPETGTPLKNSLDGQRPVGLPRAVCDVLDEYVSSNRYDSHDEHDRQPLFSTQYGRMSRSTLRSDCYMATFPCHVGPCPHGKDPRSCEYLARHHSSKCTR